MKKELTKKDYDNYMKVVNHGIKETERRLKTLDKSKKVSQLSFEDWVKFQNGELKISLWPYRWRYSQMKIEIPLYDIKIKFYFDKDLDKSINKIKRKHKKKKLYKINKLL